MGFKGTYKPNWNFHGDDGEEQFNQKNQSGRGMDLFWNNSFWGMFQFLNTFLGHAHKAKLEFVWIGDRPYKWFLLFIEFFFLSVVVLLACQMPLLRQVSLRCHGKWTFSGRFTFSLILSWQIYRCTVCICGLMHAHSEMIFTCFLHL